MVDPGVYELEHWSRYSATHYSYFWIWLLMDCGAASVDPGEGSERGSDERDPQNGV